MGVYLASIAPERVGRVMTLATKYLWTQEAAEKELGMMEADTIATKLPKFASMLEARHSAIGWREVMARSRTMITELGQGNLLNESALNTIEHPIRVVVGDRDTTVNVEEAAKVARALPNGELEVLPRTPHPLEKVSTERLARSINEFFVV